MCPSWPYKPTLSDETGHERPDSSKIKTSVLQVMLVAPMVCTAPILFSKIIVNEKNWCDVFICLQNQSDKDAIIKRCTLSSPKKQIKTCNREV